jgi:hypothetical protein
MAAASASTGVVDVAWYASIRASYTAGTRSLSGKTRRERARRLEQLGVLLFRAQLLDLVRGREVDGRRGWRRLLTRCPAEAVERPVAPEPSLGRRRLQLQRRLERLERLLAIRDLFVETRQRAFGSKPLK